MQSASARRQSEHRLALIAGLAAALPVIVSTIRAIADGWVPLGDEAIIATRSLDVLSLRPPLLGQYSVSSEVTGETTYSLGPLLYWLLAIPARIGPVAMTLAIGVVNTAAVIGAVGLARRRGGVPLMLATAAGLALMCASVRPEILHSIWNPSAALLPFALLVFLSWSVACGEYRLLPLTIVVASFVVQCHLTYVAPALGMLAVAAAGLWFARRGRWARARPWLVATLAAGLVCWSFPLVDQAINRPGNLVAVAKSAGAGGEKLGPEAGWNVLVRAAGVPPWWLRGPREGIDRLADVVQSPGALAQVTAALVLAGLVLALAVALSRRRTDVAAACAIALVLVLSLAAVAAGTPTKGGLFTSIGYTLRWGSVAGMFAWLALGWSAATLVRARAPRSPALARAGLAAGAAAALAAGVVVAARGTEDRLQSAYEPASYAADRLRLELPADAPVVVRSAAGSTGFDFRFDFAAAIAYELRRDGRRVYTPGLALGAEYAEPPPADAPVVEVGGVTATSADAVRISSARVTAGDDRPPGGGPPRPRTVTVDLVQTGR